MNKNIQPFYYALLSIISGSLIVLAFPTYYLHFFAWIALVPLMFVIKFNDPKHAFFYSMVCGLVNYVWGFWWITNSMIDFGGMPVYLAIIVLFLFSLYHALLYGAFGYFSKKLLNAGFSNFIVFPLVYTFLVFIFPTIFPWSLANSQIENVLFAQSADLFGFIGQNVFILLLNTAILNLVTGVKGNSLKKPLGEFFIILALIGGLHVYGYYRNIEVRRTEPYKSFKVAIIQGNLGIDMLDGPNFTKKSFETYKRMTEQYVNYDLIVWPESSVPLSYTQNLYFKRNMDDIVQKINSNIIFGSWDERVEKGERRGYSSAFLIGNEKEYQVYDKIKLLPFGDYMPFDETFPFLRKLVVGVGRWTPGKEIKVLDANGIKIAPSICYEILIPGLNRKFINKGAEVIVNMTNDTWFGNSKESYQHMGLARARAIELRRPLVRSTNTGVSAFISMTGKVLVSIGLFEEKSIAWEMNLRKIYSFYAEFGNLLLYLYFLITGVGIVLCYIKKRI